MTNLISLHDAFTLPKHLHAHTPAEHINVNRENVKLLHTERGMDGIHHRQLNDLPQLLQPNDLLIFNRSRTIPAQLFSESQQVTIRLARQLSEWEWEALILNNDANASEINLQEGVMVELLGTGSEAPLTQIMFHHVNEPMLSYLHKYGEPIRYEYINTPWPLEAYQTVFASAPGSIEMPSAGRAFSWTLIQALQKHQIQVGFLTLHAGISYYENNQWPNPTHHPESYEIPDDTVTAIQQAKAKGGRIIAVGTTVVRALETYAQAPHVCKGETNLYIKKETPLQLVDGLLSGLHEPHSSHLDLLRAFLSDDTLLVSYQQALQHEYLWHEFGDLHLML
ncbi:S-adenosylmethionine:tRNA ribosyltransferase-isomerase [Shouchella sp. 1P09AA]|uniref:S-adenosylmethionine:tRNA ribosyltransferase-isomerase n=1 Tax=unclassified Shouchella TaxID=2893065 RepID=UPI0039A09345